MLLSRLQNAGQNQEIKIGNRCFENVAQFRYLGMTVTNQNPIQEVIKEKAELHNLFVLCCLKNVKIRIYKTIILPVVLCGC
jgi:hypothetical protein